MYNNIYDIEDIYGGKNVIFIPNYIVAGLEAVGVTLGQLEDIMINSTNEIESFKLLANKLSKYDVMDLYLTNMYLPNQLLGEDNHGSLHDFIKYDMAKNYNLEELKKRYIDVLNNLLNKDTILMSENDDDSAYTLDVKENTIFVVLHDGFSDLLLNSDGVKRLLFYKILVNKMFNVFGEEHTLKTSLYKAYLKQIKTKYTK